MTTRYCEGEETDVDELEFHDGRGRYADGTDLGTIEVHVTVRPHTRLGNWPVTSRDGGWVVGTGAGTGVGDFDVPDGFVVPEGE